MVSRQAIEIMFDECFEDNRAQFQASSSEERVRHRRSKLNCIDSWRQLSRVLQSADCLAVGGAVHRVVKAQRWKPEVEFLEALISC